MNNTEVENLFHSLGIWSLVEHHNFSKSDVAKLYGISPRTVGRRIDKLSNDGYYSDEYCCDPREYLADIISEFESKGKELPSLLSILNFDGYLPGEEISNYVVIEYLDDGLYLVVDINDDHDNGIETKVVKFEEIKSGSDFDTSEQSNDEVLEEDEVTFVPIQCIILNDTVIVVRNGVPCQLDKSHKNFTKIYDILVNKVHDNKISAYDLDKIYKLIDVKSALEEFTQGAVTIVKNNVFLNDTKIDGRVVHVLLNCFDECDEDGLSRFSNFLEKVSECQSWKVVNRLYDFLEKSDLMVDHEGRVVAYKVVRSTYMDKYSNTMDNSPGNIVEMPRNEVDDRDEVTCSKGLHVCSQRYIKEFYSNGDRIVRVAVDPRDWVSVPVDYDFSKARVCRYEVLDDVTDEVLNMKWHISYSY